MSSLFVCFVFFLFFFGSGPHVLVRRLLFVIIIPLRFIPEMLHFKQYTNFLIKWHLQKQNKLWSRLAHWWTEKLDLCAVFKPQYQCLTFDYEKTVGCLRVGGYYSDKNPSVWGEGRQTKHSFWSDCFSFFSMSVTSPKVGKNSPKKSVILYHPSLH